MLNFQFKLKRNRFFRQQVMVFSLVQIIFFSVHYNIDSALSRMND